MYGDHIFGTATDLYTIAVVDSTKPVDKLYGELYDPWANEIELCPEGEETPEPQSFGSILAFMELTPAEAKEEYLRELDDHISPEMLKAVPDIKQLLLSEDAIKCFVPTEWHGLKIEPIDLQLTKQLPDHIYAKARPIRPDLFAHAQKEFERLSKYFYEHSEAPYASPLVIAPKATSPFIRFCGDYREINMYIARPQWPIPNVPHELTKASKFKIYVDMDMTNSFHQIPITEKFKNLLSVRTPWGLVRPNFLPEGVGPASGLLQMVVRQILEEFEEWTIVIFDNFLVLAHDYQDAAQKLKQVLAKCAEYRVVLKLKKSWFGYTKVNFFGYEVEHGHWRLSQERKNSIKAMQFPKSKKEMQSFLGAALFFHNHMPDYSEWVAKLYAMTHEKFNWNQRDWTFDYRAHFEKFKDALQQATELYFPDYSLPWIIRCDASEHAIGAVLYQEFTGADGIVVHQPIMFHSKRFSEPATKWDAYKREAFAIFSAVNSFSWYLRAKDFIIETDHRNLQWIETSQSPIVVRWRALLQSFNFLIRHIPGRENRVADWISRMSPPDLE